MCSDVPGMQDSNALDVENNITLAGSFGAPPRRSWSVEIATNLQ